MQKHGGEIERPQYSVCHNPVESPADSITNDLAKITLAQVFANVEDGEEEIHPVTISEIASQQRTDHDLKGYFNKNIEEARTNERYSLKVIDETDVLVYDDKRLVIPTNLQSKVVQWYHHYLMHPGHTRLEETIAATMYWRSLRSDVRRHVKRCQSCQRGKKRKRKYGKLPTKTAEIIPWRSVCVDLIGPYTFKGKDGTVLDFMCLTMIDPATGWFEIVELPLASVTIVRKGEEIVEIILDKSSAQISKLFNKQWLSRYPRSKFIIFDNGSEFKLHFTALCDSYRIKQKPTTVKNPQANAILERIHGVFGDMMRTSNLDMADTVTSEMVDDFITNAAWAVRSTHHTVLRSTPGAAIFGRDMLFDIPYIADWKAIGQRRQQLVDQNTAQENAKRVDFDYQVGQKVMLRQDGTLRKAADRYIGPFAITQVHTNGTIRIQRGSWSERLNIRRVTPYYE
jgi:transposase InsO family protein